MLFLSARGVLAEQNPPGRLALHPASAMVRLTGPGAADLPAEAQRYEVELARNESEAFQVLVQRAGDAQSAGPAQVEAGIQPLSKAETQPVLRAYQVLDVHYTGPAHHPQFKVPVRNVGWIPDVCLPGRLALAEAHKRSVTFLFDVHAPATLQLAAPTVFEYRISFRESPEAPAANLNVSVRVYPFALPRRLPFRTSVTWNWGIEKYLGRKLTDAERLAWLDFFLDYRFTPASFWARGPDFSDSELAHIVQRGGNVFQVCANLGKRPLTDQQKTELTPKLRAWRQTMETAGALRDCYALVADEPDEKQFPVIRANAEWLKSMFPEVRIWVATAPRMELLDVVDAWDVVTAASTALYEPHKFTPENYALARRAAKKPEYWWFYSVEPYAPHPNARLDDQLVDARAIGSLSFAQGVDGFEYFWATDWESNVGLKAVPYPQKAARWQPGLAGAGILCYPDQNGMPSPSLRLINLRDGLEDWAVWDMAPDCSRAALAQAARNPDALARLRHEIYEALARRMAGQ
jgi:hypothetical protein